MISMLSGTRKTRGISSDTAPSLIASLRCSSRSATCRKSVPLTGLLGVNPASGVVVESCASAAR